MPELTPELVNELASGYPVEYDALYFENIGEGTGGNVDALRALTRWKNGGANFENHPKKKSAWDYFLEGLERYLTMGSEELRADFTTRAPVWAMFWHHVLYGTPIFDVNTHTAFRFFAEGISLTRKQAQIHVGGHWTLYDSYCSWFNEQLAHLQTSDPCIDARTLDRALFMYGRING